MSVGRPSPEIHEVDPDRLAFGRWDHSREAQLGEGDIVGSYSGDRIGMNQPVRRPFRFRNRLWLCTGITTRSGEVFAEAYTLTDPGMFEGCPTTYPEKTRDAEAARRDPAGFYHGMAIRSGGRTLILSGPPVVFVRGQEAQADLFATSRSPARVR